MTYELQQQLQTVAIKDGWVLDPHPDNKGNYIKDGKTCFPNQFDYHTNIASLYPVAVKVIEELRQICEQLNKGRRIAKTAKDWNLWGKMGAKKWEAQAAISKIEKSAFNIPDLFQSVYNGIELLNSLNK